LINYSFAYRAGKQGLEFVIFTGLFSARFRRINNDHFTEKSVAISDSVTYCHTLFGYPVVIYRLSRSYNIQVKNAVSLKEKNR